MYDHQPSRKKAKRTKKPSTEPQFSLISLGFMIQGSTSVEPLLPVSFVFPSHTFPAGDGLLSPNSPLHPFFPAPSFPSFPPITRSPSASSSAKAAACVGTGAIMSSPPSSGVLGTLTLAVCSPELSPAPPLFCLPGQPLIPPLLPGGERKLNFPDSGRGKVLERGACEVDGACGESDITRNVSSTRSSISIARIDTSR